MRAGSNRGKFLVRTTGTLKGCVPSRGDSRLASRSRVLLVDDDPISREGLARLIRREPEFLLAGQADEPEIALRAIRFDRPDLVLLDLSLTGGTGTELICTICRRHPGIRILALSAQEEVSTIEEALRAGAMGYISKRTAFEDVVQALRTLVRGELFVSRDLFLILLRHLIERRDSQRLSDLGSSAGPLEDSR